MSGKRGIWVYRGGWCFWDDGFPLYDFDAGFTDLSARFLDESPFLYISKPLTGQSPISGVYENVTLCVLDDTPVYLGELTVSEVFGPGELTIAAGTLHTKSIRAGAGIFIAPDARVYTSGEISSGGFLNCLGGVIKAQSLDARRIWFQSSAAPLYVSVKGSVITTAYIQKGGETIIGGGLISIGHEDGADAGILLDCEQARHNKTSLCIGGDVISSGKCGGIEISGADKRCSVQVSGGMKAEHAIIFRGGNTFIHGALESRGDTGGIHVYGGVINTESLYAARAIEVGTADDIYGTNDTITLFVAKRVKASGCVNIYGGAVYEGASYKLNPVFGQPEIHL